MNQNNRLRIFTVVDVWRGMAVGAKSFINLRNARDYMQRVARGRNLEEDDVQVFQDFILSSRVKKGVVRKRKPNSLPKKRRRIGFIPPSRSLINGTYGGRTSPLLRVSNPRF